MAKIKKVNELEFPSKNGWYWVLINGYTHPIPCWFSKGDSGEDSYFLAGGVGDSSSCGLYQDEIDRIGPEIIEPKF